MPTTTTNLQPQSKIAGQIVIDQVPMGMKTSGSYTASRQLIGLDYGVQESNEVIYSRPSGGQARLTRNTAMLTNAELEALELAIRQGSVNVSTQ